MALPLAAAGWYLLQEPGGRPVDLPDGSSLQLRGVSSGTRHHFPGGRFAQQWLGSVLPESWRAPDLASFTTPRPALVPLFVLRDPVPGAVRDVRVEVYDAHGCRFGSGTQVRLSPAGPDPGRERPRPHASWAVLDSFPRSDRQVYFRLFSGQDPTPLAEFAAENPAPAPPADSSAAGPAPEAASSRGVRVTLGRLRNGLTWEALRGEAPAALRERMDAVERTASWPGARGAAVGPPARLEWTLAELKVEQSGRRTSAWHPYRLELADMEGNGVRLASSRGAGEGFLAAWTVDRFTVAFPTPLCREDPAWRLRVSLAFSGSDEDFRHADFRWTVRNLPVPGRKQLLFPGRAAEKNGVRLRLEQFAGVGAAFPDAPEWDVDLPNLRVSARAPEDDVLRLSLKATDERGKPVQCPFRGGPAPNDPPGPWFWQFDLPREARRVNVQLAGWRGRTVEFTVHPGSSGSGP